MEEEIRVPNFDACVKAFKETMRDVLSADGITLEDWESRTPFHEQFYLFREFLRHSEVFMEVASKNVGIARRKATRRRRNEQDQ